MGLTDTIFGTPGTVNIQQSPATRPPGYRQAGQIFNWLLNLTNTPFPTYQGKVDPGLSPTMQDLIRRSQGYASAGAPEILQGVQGTLGGFMNANFLNPIPRIFGGSSDYTNAGSAPWNNQYRFNPFQATNFFGNGGGQNSQGGQPYQGSQSPQGGQNAWGGQNSPSSPPQMSGPSQYSFPSASPPPLPATERQQGAKPMWDMGAGANRGQIRQGAGGPEILVGAGGGEQYKWVPYTGDYGQAQNAHMFQRYGSNWTAGSGSSGGHSSDVKYWLQNALGRAPSQDEVNDHYYGVKDVRPYREQAARDNARYNPSSGSYDPNSQRELVDLWRRPRNTTPPTPTGGA